MTSRKAISTKVLIPLSILLLGAAPIWQKLPVSLDGLVDVWWLSRDSQTLSSTYGEHCLQDFSVEILSADPLILYINNFITDEEINHMLRYSESQFQRSTVYNKKLETIIDKEYRTSQSAMLPLADPVSVCVSQRMKALLGNLQHLATEAVQIVKYEPGELFRMHMDWFDTPRNASHPQKSEMEEELNRRKEEGEEEEEENKETKVLPYNRLASIFAYLDDDCDGGETFFPLVRGVSPRADGAKFARTETGQGLLVRPMRGNAVFWMNLLANGTGDTRVAHSGRRVRRGTKIGINLFSYYYYDKPMVG